MIRMTYPGPPLHPFRQHLELAARRTRQVLQRRRSSLRAERGVSSVSHLNTSFGKRCFQEEFDRVQAIYNELYEEYDALIGLLCVAANEGIRPEHETEYHTRRAWFKTHYPEIKQHISAYLETDAKDTAPTFLGRSKTCDAFEALFFPPTIAIMLKNDNGNLIGRFLRTQAALENWSRSLRRAA